jgi:hypothetical protein
VRFDVSTLLYAALAIVVGLQAIFFFVTARVFGIAEGLLPDDPSFTRRVGRLAPEWGLVLGALLTVTGVALSAYALVTWNDAGFGDLDYPHILRIVIPGVTLIACGLQTALSSLFVGMLGLRRR